MDAKTHNNGYPISLDKNVVYSSSQDKYLSPSNCYLSSLLHNGIINNDVSSIFSSSSNSSLPISVQQHQRISRASSCDPYMYKMSFYHFFQDIKERKKKLTKIKGDKHTTVAETKNTNFTMKIIAIEIWHYQVHHPSHQRTSPLKQTWTNVSPLTMVWEMINWHMLWDVIGTITYIA